MRRPVARLMAAISLSVTLLSGCGGGQTNAPSTFDVPATALSGQVLVPEGALGVGIARLKRHRFGKTGSTLARIDGSTSQQLQALVNNGADVIFRQGNLLIADVPDRHYQQLKAQSNLHLTPIGPGEGYSIIENDYDPHYRTYAQLTSQLHSLAQRYPTIMELQDIGDSWEKTKGIASRDIWAVRLSSQRGRAIRPGIIFMGCHHARELVSSEIPLKLIEYLTENYGKDADVTRWLDTLEVWIVPMVNPDGHVKAEQGHDWRKNTDNGGRGAMAGPDGPGVDLNRNYAYKWGGVGSSHDPDSAIYAGSAAFSEPETQTMREFYRSHRNLKLSLSYHSFSNLILYPWAHTYNPTPDKALFEKIARRMGDLSGYTPEQSSELYLHSGEANDWIYGEFKVPAFTAEVGGFDDGFDPPYSRMDAFWRENLAVAKYLLSIAANPRGDN